MPAALARAIGIPAKQQHSDETRNKRNRADPANALNISPTGEPLKHGRHPKPKGVAAGITEEQPSSEHQHRRMPKRLPNRNVFYMCFGAPLFSKTSTQPIALVRLQPSHFVRPIRQHEQCRDSMYDRGHAFQQEGPWPSASVEPLN